MRFVELAIIMLWLCIGCSCAYGQDPYFINITTANGLPSNSVYCIMQDSKGFIWVAHDEGLSRYDGNEFKTYTSKYQTSKPGTNISEDKYGRIWYQNFDGYIYYVENDRLNPLPEQKNPAGFTPYAILDSVLISISQNRINFYDIKTLKLKLLVSDSTVGYNHAIAGSNRYYAAFGKLNYTIYPDGRIEKTNIVNGIPVIAVEERTVKIDRADFDGWAYEEINGEKRKLFNLQKAGFIQSAMYTRGLYWFCTTLGAFAFMPDGTAFNNGMSFFKNKNLSNVFKDREGNYWFGTINEGILFVPDLNTKLVEIPKASPSCILVDSNEVLIASNKTEVYSLNTKTFGLTLKYKNDVAHDVVAFKKDKYHNRYIVVAQSLNVLDKNFKEVSAYTRSTKDLTIINSKYYAFSATGVAGLIKTENTSTSDWDKLYDAFEKDITGHVSMLYVNQRFKSVEYSPHSSALYFAGNNGLYKATASGNKPKEILLENAAIYATQLKLYNKQIFALTPRNTLLSIDSNDNIKQVNIGNGIELYKLFKVNNQLLVLTSRGLKQYDNTRNSLIASDVLKGVNADDIRDINSTGDTLITATNRGIIISPVIRPVAHIAPVFHITSVTINNKARKADSVFQLNYEEKNVEIEYALLSYRNPGDDLLYYKINDGEWSLLSKNSGSLKLAALSPGSYKVWFTTGDHLGSESAHMKSVIFNIKTPYWATYWFLILCIILIASLVFTYFKWRTGILKKQNQLLTEKVQLERNLHQSVLTSIRSQMNPHFFYNALNTIQSFIVTDDKRNASTYLSKFSKLTRTILEMTGKESVTLSEEMNALKLYLDLEKVRFNNEFHYAINVINGLDVDMVKIPSMIVQPYVENSIKHGLLHKNGEKVLLIDFLKRDNNLSIIIDDNGIGRKKSTELNKIRKDKHKPFATEANMKRIEILNKGNNNIGVVYTDKTDAFGQSNGTIVTLTIPLIKD